jgi:hypothetical protein
MPIIPLLESTSRWNGRRRLVRWLLQAANGINAWPSRAEHITCHRGATRMVNLGVLTAWILLLLPFRCAIRRSKVDRRRTSRMLDGLFRALAQYSPHHTACSLGIVDWATEGCKSCPIVSTLQGFICSSYTCRLQYPAACRVETAEDHCKPTTLSISGGALYQIQHSIVP